MKYFFLVFFVISQTATADTKLAAHLLSYLAQDYGVAVQDGKVISKPEYDEQLEFIAEVVRSGEKERFPEDIKADVTELQKLILSKSPHSRVAELASDIRWRLIRHYQISTGPEKEPDPELGKNLYLKSCASCHGITGYGDGEDGKGLDPAPANFHDTERFRSVSPFQAFNTITLGVPGTGMRAFAELSEHERWSLASYVLDFHYNKAVAADPKEDLSPGDRWSLSDDDLEKKYGVSGNEFLRFMRQKSREGMESGQSEKYLDLALSKLGASLLEFKTGNKDKSSKLAFESYLEGVEPIEPLIGRKRISEIEADFLSYRSMIRQSQAWEDVAREHEKLVKRLQAVRPLLRQEHAFMQSFFFSFGIVFREIMEAALVILLLLSMLKKLGATGSSSWIHGGWIPAVVIGIALAIILDRSLEASGVIIENLEGYIGLVAVVMLLSLALWLHGHSQIEQWKAYLQEQMRNHLMNKQMLGLSLLSFTAVFREMVETILFIKILRLNGHSESAVFSGVVIAIVVTFALVYIMLKLSVRVNLGKLMRVSTVALVFFAITLAGRSVHALQLAGTLPSTEISRFSLPFFGIYGTWESLSLQLALVLIVMVTELRKKRALK